MKSIRSIFHYSVLAASVALAGCSGGGGDDDVTAVVAPPEQPAPSTCPDVGNLTVTELGDNQCEIGGVLTENATLTSAQTWFLEGSLQVGEEANAVTLDIQAGTEIRGDNVDAVDYVLVFPGSALVANGTSADPVRFLSDDDDVDGSGEWGGVFGEHTTNFTLIIT